MTQSSRRRISLRSTNGVFFFSITGLIFVATVRRNSQCDRSIGKASHRMNFRKHESKRQGVPRIRNSVQRFTACILSFHAIGRLKMLASMLLLYRGQSAVQGYREWPQACDKAPTLRRASSLYWLWSGGCAVRSLCYLIVVVVTLRTCWSRDIVSCYLRVRRS